MTVWWALTVLATGNHVWKSKDKKDVDRTHQESKGHPPRGPHFLPVLFFSWSCILPLPGGLSHIFIHEDLTPCLIYFSSITSAQWTRSFGPEIAKRHPNQPPGRPIAPHPCTPCIRVSPHPMSPEQRSLFIRSSVWWAQHAHARSQLLTEQNRRHNPW